MKPSDIVPIRQSAQRYLAGCVCCSGLVGRKGSVRTKKRKSVIRTKFTQADRARGSEGEKENLQIDSYNIGHNPDNPLFSFFSLFIFVSFSYQSVFVGIFHSLHLQHRICSPYRTIAPLSLTTTQLSISPR